MPRIWSAPTRTRNRNQRISSCVPSCRARIAAAPPIAQLLAMLTLLAAAVLFVACANVAGLLTSRAPVRAREIAMRLAIGAGRPRVVRQLITESVLIALAGGVLGLGVGYAGGDAVQADSDPDGSADRGAFELDRRALLVSLVVALVSAVLFGLAPAIRSTRADLTAVMKATMPRASAGAGGGAARVLVAWTGGRLRGPAGGGHIRLSRISAAALERSGLSHRSSADDELSRRTSWVTARRRRSGSSSGRRARPARPRRQIGRADPLHADGRWSPPVTIVPEGFSSRLGRRAPHTEARSWTSITSTTMGVPILKGRASNT